MRKGFERIHGWQTSGLSSWSSWKVDGWWISPGKFVDETSDWNTMGHMLQGTARSPFCICPKTGTSFLPSCAAGVPTFLLHVISRLAGCLEQWQQSCEGGPSLSKVLQCNRPSPPKWKGVFQKNKGLALNYSGQIHDTWMHNDVRWVELLDFRVHATLGENRQLAIQTKGTSCLAAALTSQIIFSKRSDTHTHTHTKKKQIMWHMQHTPPLPIACLCFS